MIVALIVGLVVYAALRRRFGSRKPMQGRLGFFLRRSTPGKDDGGQVLHRGHLRHEGIRSGIPCLSHASGVLNPRQDDDTAADPRLRRRRVASIPSMTGICKSIRMTSGLSEAAIVNASRPWRARPTTSIRSSEASIT
jgi:hypothetical protein